MGVDGAHEEGVAEDRKSAVDPPAAGARLRRRRVLVAPEHPAEFRVDRQHGVRRLRGVHHPVHNERRRLERLERLRLEDPLQLKLIDVLRRNLIERRMAL